MKTTEIKMHGAICFMVLVVASVAQGPCEIYKPFPRAAERLIDNIITDDQLTIINDRYIIEGWYGLRTRVLASGTAPETNHCGTQHPIYLEAAPTRNVGIEQNMTACTRLFRRTCYLSFTVRAKYCGDDLFVFYLDNSPVASSGYCLVPNEITGTAIPTFNVLPKVNITIETVEMDIIDQDNVVKNEVKAFRFFCDFVQSDEALFYRAVWRIPDTLTYRSPVINGSDSHLRYNLSLSEGQIRRSAGFYISCEIQASYAQRGNLSSSNTTSKSRFIGINVLTPIVRIKEGAFGQIQVQATAEIGCIGERRCPYYVIIQIPERGDCGPSLKTDSRCSKDISVNGVNGVHNISLTAGIVDTYGISARWFQVTLQSDKYYPSHPIWGNYTIFPRIWVIIERNTTSIESKTCRLYSDPWLLPFGSSTGTRIGIQQMGTFTLYYDKDNDIEVQVQTVSCTSTNAGYCNCGMVARSRTTAYMISKCGNSSYWVIDYVRCGAGIEALKVSKADSYTYKITFPTGVTVHAKLHAGGTGTTRNRSSYVDLTVYPSVLDVGRSRGLCGQLMENETVLHIPRPPSTIFVESWKVEDTRNLFDVSVLGDLPEFNSIIYTCKCINPAVARNGPQNTTTCGADENVQVCRESSRYKAVTKRSCVNTVSRRRRSIPVHHSIHHPLSRHKRQVSWQGSWTEQRARVFCTNLFNKSAMVELCRKNVPGVDVEGSFQTCMNDIQLSGTTDFALSSTTSIHTQCVHEVYVNPVLQTQQEDKPSVLEEVEAMDCSEQCSEHGQCLNGSCKCDNGYIGDACDIPFNLPPSALEIEYGGHCDLKTQKCDDVSVFGGTFIDNKDARCRIVPSKMGINGKVDASEPQTTIPTVESISETVCPLPVRNVNPSSVPHHQQTYTGYKISVSNNGEHYSEELSMVIYNSQCMNCSKNGGDIQCLVSEKHCVTDDVCYYDSDQYTSNQDYVCRVDASGPRWELIKQETEEDNKIYIIIGAVCSVVVLIVGVIIIAVVCKKGCCKKSPGTVSPYAAHYDNTVGTGTNHQNGNNENTYDTLTPNRNDGAVYTKLN